VIKEYHQAHDLETCCELKALYHKSKCYQDYKGKKLRRCKKIIDGAKKACIDKAKKAPMQEIIREIREWNEAERDRAREEEPTTSQEDDTQKSE
jgi:hypothetical protein